MAGGIRRPRRAGALPVLCLGLLAVLPTSARGGEAERTVRWEELVGLFASAPAVRRGALSVNEAAGAAAEARQAPNPTVEGSLDRASGEGGSGLEWGAAVSMPLGWLARRGPAIAAAEASLEEARYRWAERRLDLFDELRTLFYGVAHDQEHVASVEEEVARAAELARLVRLRVDRGEARPIEALRAEAELARSENELDRARAELEIGRHRLALLVPALGDGPLRVEADLEAAAPPDLDDTLARVRTGAPAVRAAGARVRAGEAGLSAARRERLPEVAVRGFADRELDKRTVGGAVEVEVPLLSWNGGGVSRAEAALAAAEAAREASLGETLAAVAEAHQRCERERRVATRYQAEILPRAEAALATLEKTFHVGETNLLDVLDARRVAGQVRREALESRLSAKLACERVAALLAESTK
jgi:cobalt-zinc-cadmium efflux system outer membrane protein